MTNIYSIQDTLRFVQDLKSRGWEIAGSDVNVINNKYKDVSKFKLKKPTILLLGSEGTGLSDDVKSECSTLLYVKGPTISNKRKRFLFKCFICISNIAAATYGKQLKEKIFD